MKTKKYLEFYEKYAEKGWMPDCGLCYSLATQTQVGYVTVYTFDKNLNLFCPAGVKSMENYWASDSNRLFHFQEFNDTRKNIVLFLAAMNDEL